VSKQKIEFTLPADLGLSALVRRISEEIFIYAGFSLEWADRLKLVVDELFMNASRYGSKTKKSRVYLAYHVDADEVTFVIEDEGKGDEGLSAEELLRKVQKNLEEIRDLTKTGGRGLALISNFWTDHLQIDESEHGGLLISFIKKVSKGKPPSLPLSAALPSDT